MPTTPGLVRALSRERTVAALRPVAPSPTPMPAAAPVPALPALNLAPQSVYQHGAGRLDDHGRVRDAALFSALGWTPATPLLLTASADQVLVQAVPDGPGRLDSRGRLRLPESLRRLLSVRPGQTLLLSTVGGALVVSPGSLLDGLVSRATG